MNLRHAIRSGLFYLYAFLGAPWVAASVREAVEAEDARRVPALLVLAALVVETFALAVKGRRWRADRAAAGGGADLPIGLGIALCTAHVVLAMLLAFTALDALGLLGAGITPEESAPWLAVTSLAVCGREVVVFAVLAGRKSSGPPPAWLEWPAALGLLFFQCIAYSAFWQGLLDGGMIVGGPFTRAALALPITVLFFFVYLPLRLPEILADHARGTVGNSKRYLLKLAIEGTILAVYPLCWPAG